MKKMLAFFVLVVVSHYACAEKVCIDKSFMSQVPQESVRLNQYLNSHLSELIYFINKNDSTAYKTGFKVLANLINYSAIPDNSSGKWQIKELAGFLAFYDDRFIARLKKMNDSEISAIFKLYDMSMFKESQPNDYDAIKSSFSENTKQ